MSKGQDMIMELMERKSFNDLLVDTRLCYQEGIVEIHTVGTMIELSIEDAEALGYKLLALAQDYHSAAIGREVDEAFSRICDD